MFFGSIPSLYCSVVDKGNISLSFVDVYVYIHVLRYILEVYFVICVVSVFHIYLRC